jgi:Protein phosphatase 2C
VGYCRVTKKDWIWAGSKRIGTSHIRSGTGCDDFGACVEVVGPSDRALIVVVSDGAGSAKYSSIGSRIVSRVCVANASRHIADGKPIIDISLEVVKDWLDEVRDRISLIADPRGATRRDFAATAVGAIVGERTAVFFHVGDGAAAFRAIDQDEWIIASWPAQGQFASTTYFVTDDPEPVCRVTAIDYTVGHLALFTDGIERLVLDFAKHEAFSPFFKKMMTPLVGKAPGRNRDLSRQLNQFLDGKSVCEKTDDDKTLILASRAGS